MEHTLTFSEIIGFDSLAENNDSQLSLDDQLKDDLAHIQLNQDALKQTKPKINFKDLWSFERDHNRCCALYKNIIQLFKDAFAEYDISANFSSVDHSTAWNILYLEIDQLKSIGRSANEIAGKCFLSILVVFFICAPIIYTVAALIWSAINVILWSVNRHAYHQMFAPVSQSMPHLNWSGAAFLFLALPFVLTAMTFLVVGIKALCKKKQCRDKLEDYHHIHQISVFKGKLADEILASECFEDKEINKEIPNLIVSYL